MAAAGGWNGSANTGKAAEPPKSAKKAPSALRGVIAGAAVVGIAAVIAFFAFSKAEKPKATAEKKAAAIREVKPAAAPKAEEAKPEKKIEFKKLGNGKIMKYVNGKEAWMFPREDYHGPVHTTRVVRVESLEEKTFKHAADRQIASLLTIRPGSKIVGGPDYRRTFVRDFLRSYEQPFIVEPGDTEEQKELKKAVAEVKGDLKARYDAGEDIAQIMIDTRDNLRQLATYKRELEAEVNKLAREENTTSADIEDFVKAANKMLEGRGIQPMGINGFLKHQIKVLKARETSGEPVSTEK